jgi:outer membrane protein assembly factor BamB
MARPRQGFVYVGIKGNVIALDRKTGEEHWKTELKGSLGRTSSFVCVFRDPDYVFATVGGEIWCLDPKSGSVVWHNKLKGLGLGLTSIASDAMPGASGASAATVEIERQRQAAATHAATA